MLRSSAALCLMLLSVVCVPALGADLPIGMTTGELPSHGSACFGPELMLHPHSGDLAYCDGSSWSRDATNVAEHGAIGDGTHDDTAAINSALAQAGISGRVYLPAGTYLITPEAGELVSTLKLEGGIEIFGDGASKSTIRVKDAAGPYFCLLGGDTRETPLQGLRVHHLGFDHNVAGNPRSRYPEGRSDAQMSVCAFGDSANVEVHDVQVVNASSVNNITVNGVGVSDVRIHDNVFRGLGGDDGLRGSHTGPAGSATLIDGSSSWIPDGFVGRVVINATDGSFGKVTENSSTTFTVELQGGIDNAWDPGDSYFVPHDASVIYVHAAGGGGIYIADNEFVAEATTAPGARTAIETHGSHTLVTRNLINDFMKGVNLTGISTTDTTDVLASQNTIRGTLLGISLWSMTYRDHTSGFGLDGVTVESNSIELAGRQAFGGAAAFIEGGIVITRSSVTDGMGELDIRDLKILNNTISHPLEDLPVRNLGASIGIGWLSQDDRWLVDSRIEGNTVVQFPMAGIRLSCGIRNVSIRSNVLIKTGSSLDTSHAVAYRTPLFIWGAPIDGLEIARNTVVDDHDTTRIDYGIYIGLEPDSSLTGLQIDQNPVRVTGSDRSRFRQPLFIAPGVRFAP